MYLYRFFLEDYLETFFFKKNRVRLLFKIIKGIFFALESTEQKYCYFTRYLLIYFK